MSAWRVASSPSVGATHIFVNVDAAGNFEVEGMGDMRAAAVALEMLAAEVREKAEQ